MRRTLLLAGVLPFVSAFLGGLLAISLMTPSSATAQADQPGEVRASVFTLVNSDGTVLARLAPGRQGAGLLTLFEPSGTQRISVAGTGALQVFDQDGTTVVFRSGRTFVTSSDGLPPLNGVELSPAGAITIQPVAP